MKFSRWETIVDSFKRDLPHLCGMNSEEIVLEVLSMARRRYGDDTAAAEFFLDPTNTALHNIEQHWASYGRPYYKVWPGIVDALCRTNLNFDSSHLRLPYPAFEICIGGNRRFGTRGTAIVSFIDYKEMPSESELKSSDNEKAEKLYLLHQRNRAEKMIMKEERKRGKDAIGKLRFVYRMPEDDDYQKTETIVTMYKNSTIEEDLEFNSSLPRRKLPSGQRYLSKDEAHNLAKVVIGVAMFGVHNHEMVLPDIETPVVVGRGKKKKALERQAIRKENKECKGWLVGSEIDLPQPEVIGSTNERPGCGTPLKFGHIRSGHMRMQPCGPQGKDRKLIFVEPTVVRPDLAARQSHGYRIKDTLLTGN